MNTPINIIYPIHGKNYPTSNPLCPKLKSAYLTFAFSVTRDGGSYKVSWGIDSKTLGKTVFYDFYNNQFVFKVPSGKHVFWVKSGGKSSKVKFSI